MPTMFPLRPAFSRNHVLPALLVWLSCLVVLPGQTQAQGQAPFDPPALYAMWEKDPTTTISLLWHTRNDVAREAKHPAELEIRPKGGSARTSWKKVKALSSVMPHSNRTIRRVALRGLKPGAEYSFRFGQQGRSYSFRTMPATLEQPVRFAAGGDTMHNQAMFEKTNLQVLKHDVDFVVFGGDLAYADGKPEQVGRWYNWFDVCKRTLITPEGRVIPIVVTIGNHEVQGAFNQPYEKAPFFYSLFPFPGRPGYGVLDFGKYLSLVVLDTGHTAPIGGAQTQWLEKTLAARRKVPHVFPVYHVPIYPSVRKYNDNSAQLLNWAPLFEKYGVRIAFENHDHAYKRTHPIRAGKIQQGGVVYLGDGCWGVATRPVATDRWYLAKASSVRHFILGTLQGKERRFLMLDEDGNTIDTYPAVSP